MLSRQIWLLQCVKVSRIRSAQSHAAFTVLVVRKAGGRCDQLPKGAHRRQRVALTTDRRDLHDRAWQPAVAGQASSAG